MSTDVSEYDEEHSGPHPVTLEDCSAFSMGERLQNYLSQYGGKDLNKRAEVYDLAWQAAMEEMVNEQHTMLMAICDKLGIQGGWK